MYVGWIGIYLGMLLALVHFTTRAEEHELEIALGTTIEPT
jgi:hypothetical protein